MAVLTALPIASPTAHRHVADPAVIRKILAHLARSHSGQSPGPVPPESERRRIGSGARQTPVVLAPRGGVRAESAGPPAN